MKSYQKRIRGYKQLIQKNYVRESAVRNTAEQCADIVNQADIGRASCFQFLFEHSRPPRKRWWGIQGMMLLLLWFLLADSDGAETVERALDALSVAFSLMIIPEVWKNRRYSAVEIEKTAYYSLRQICAARILLFAAADLVMITIFFAVSFRTLPISGCRIVINFLIPFNVSCCICFRLLYSRWSEMEYIAVLLSMLCVILWTVIVTNDFIYRNISMPVWAALILVSFVYLVYCIRKSQCNCETVWEGKANETAV